MKNILIAVAILTIGLLFSTCYSENNALLLDEVEIDADFNPVTSQFATGEKVYAWMVDDSTVLGYGGGYAFYTPNDFDSVYAIAGSIKEELLFTDFENIVVAPTDQANNDFLLEQSDDFGANYTTKLYKSYFENSTIDSTLVQGTHSNWQTFMLSQDAGWTFSKYLGEEGVDVFPSALKMYEITYDFNTDENILIWKKDLNASYTINEIYFASATLGWLLITYQGDANILVTADGGNTWDGPHYITTNNTPTRLYSVDGELLIAFSGTHKYLYTSTNNGISWQSNEIFFANTGINDLQFIDQNIGYAVSVAAEDGLGKISDVYKTNDGGSNWDKVNSSRIYAETIDFSSEQVGLAMSKNVVQITRDGGVNWQVEIYPLE